MSILPKHSRQPLSLFYVEELTAEEIASVLKEPVALIERNLSVLNERLSRQLGTCMKALDEKLGEVEEMGHA